MKNRKKHVKLPFIYLRCKKQSKDYILTKGTNLWGRDFRPVGGITNLKTVL